MLQHHLCPVCPLTTVTRPELSSRQNWAAPPTEMRHCSRLAVSSEASRQGILTDNKHLAVCSLNTMHYFTYLDILDESKVRMDWISSDRLSRERTRNCWLRWSALCLEKERTMFGPFWSLAM